MVRNNFKNTVDKDKAKAEKEAKAAERARKAAITYAKSVVQSGMRALQNDDTKTAESELDKALDLLRDLNRKPKLK